MSSVRTPQLIKYAPTGKAAKAARAGILHLTSDLEIGQRAREVVDSAILAHRSGWRPIIASAGGALVTEAERTAVRHSAIPLNRHNVLANWRNRVQLEVLIQRERPALVHAHGFDMLAQACSLGAIHRLPILVDLSDPAPALTPILLKTLQLAVSREARFRVPSEYMVRYMQQDCKLESDYLYHIPPGVDLRWYDAVRVTPERLQRLSALWRLPEQATVVIMATPLAPGYGHKNLLEAIARLKNDAIFLVMVGDDGAAPGTRAKLEKLIASSGLEGKVIMPENCADWPAACWLASLVVAINTVPRGHAPELLAAQAIGRPVIVSDCGANPEMVRGGETAWIVPNDDKNALDAALKEAVRMNAAQRIDLALRTRDFVAEVFPQDVWHDSLLELYRTMLPQPMRQAMPQQVA